MERYFPKRKIDEVVNQEPQSENRTNASIRPRVETNLDDLPIDPGKRKNIYTMDGNDREILIRFYLQKGPFQPKMIFPRRQCGERNHRFVFTWFNDHPSWLEYSVSEDSCYCLFCYLFKPEHGGQSGGDVFVTKGFTNWKEAVKKFRDHVGEINSIHHKFASVAVAKLCLSQALAFRGHDESEDSTKKGNFITFLQFLADHNEEIKKVVLDKASENDQLTSPRIQKDIVRAMALETTKIILNELGDYLFSILVDESRDISIKEQMVVLLRYVDNHGCIVERFLGVVHVNDTTSLSLKASVVELLEKHNLSITNHTDDHGLRGINDGLSRALQKKDQDIINAMNLVNVTKYFLKIMRRDRWDDFIQEVTLFYEKHEIVVVDMNASFVDPRRALRKSEVLTNYHVYHNDKFVDILEKQVEELNDRFSEIGTDLLLGMSCLDPQNSFHAFDKEKLIKFSKFYPSKFYPTQIMELEWALPVYFEDVSHDDRFSILNGIAGLAKKMVETGKHLIHRLVYLLVKLAMLLPVATTGVERSFSSMNIVKTRLRNRIGDEWLNDILVTYVECDIFLTVKTEDVLQRFQNMKPRRITL
ncbi:zinc finger MYM-type protein 1-like [Heracleum sosnowskyi]|uniref:Zinc finger MYM-type protein 1-like n=1 Tax=Heracleum sosnowskyi TaxID=360622 RepID=A0AAD8HB15_9APIA|nr:zinc finger MYM-type protein 1-like [Heracleum sosnowskyi]